MPSIEALKASDGTGNASVATVTNARSGGATTIQVDTVQDIPTNFHGTMGTPHTFSDPVTGEDITIISEATAVDFKGHVDSSNLEIDTIAPGYTDGGSEVGDIVVIKPTTQWADAVVSVLETSLNDDGTLKSDIVEEDNMTQKISEMIADFVASGGVWTQNSGLDGDMTALAYYIAGTRYTVDAVSARSFTASKDTYIDVGANETLDYTEVTNGAAAPALSASHLRIAKVVTDGSGITDIVQIGQDSLGNSIYPTGASQPSVRSGGFHIGVISGSTLGSTGNKSITGVGFKPKYVSFHLLPTASDAALQSMNGGMTEDSQFITMIGVLEAGAQVMRYSSTSNCLGWGTNSSTPTLLASKVSLDDDGFTINVGTATSSFDVGFVAYG